MTGSADAVAARTERIGVRRPRDTGRSIECDVPARTRAAAGRRPRRDDRERAEHAQRQADLLAVVAHELRNPLTPIRMAATLLAEAGSDPALLLHIRAVIERQVEHMSRLVDDLLDASRVTTGKLRIERGAADPIGFVNTAVEACRSSLDARRQRLRVDLPPVVPVLHGDPVRLTQVVGNLIDNASKFTPREGEIGVSLAVLPNAIVITVSDSGIGLAADELSDLFEPFVQSPRATGFDDRGLGIGLSVVRELVEAHGGTVVARSAGSGSGSRFIVTLPVGATGPHAGGRRDVAEIAGGASPAAA